MKTHAAEKTHTHAKFWLETAWPEGAEVMMVASFAAAGTNMAWAHEVFDEHAG